MTEIKFEIVKHIGTLSEVNKRTKEINLIKWGGSNSKPRLDIRNWYLDEEGNKKPGKGTSLNSEEAELMVNTLNEFFEDESNIEFDYIED